MNVTEPLIIMLGATAIAMALLVVQSKSLVYSAAFLGFLGLANASIFALLGYGLVAIIHIVVYVGAAALFIVMAVTMMKEPPKQYTNLTLGLMSGALFFIILMGIIWTSPQGPIELTPSPVEYSAIVDYFISNARPAVIILVISLAAALIGSIHIARSKEVV